MTNTASLNRTLFLEDNLPVLRGLDSKSVDLIATDPPFNKGVPAFEGTTKAGVNVSYKDVPRLLLRHGNLGHIYGYGNTPQESSMATTMPSAAMTSHATQTQLRIPT